MAGGGVGEAVLLGTAIGAGTGGAMSAIQDKDVGQGMLLGALGGAATGGIGSQIGGAAAGAAGTGAEVVAPTVTENLVGSGLSTGGADVLATGGVQAAETVGADTAKTAALNWGQQGVGQGIAPTLSNAQLTGAATTGGISGLAAANGQPAPYQAPGTETYNGPLSKFKMAGPSLSQYSYDPNTFKPSVAPGYAQGGIADLQNQSMYPQSQYQHTAFNMPSQTPISSDVLRSGYDSMPDGYDEVMMAHGGIADLGSYSDGGRLLRGPGDGMSDDIPASIAGKQPARLADGEFVVPADVVSHLGNGSTDAGAKTLYSMMDKVRKARTGSKKQGRDINPDKYMPKMGRGSVARFDEGGDTTTDQTSDQPAQAAPPPPYNPSVYNPTTYNYSPYTVANRPSGNAPQYYGDIYQGATPDYSTPGYTLAGNLGQWSNVAGEAQRAAQPASVNQQVTQAYLQHLGRAPDQQGFNYWMQSGLTGPQAARTISVSPEAAAVDPTGAAGQNYIGNLYSHYLGRSPDAAGLEYWRNQLADYTTPGQLETSFQNAAVQQAYQNALGSSPDQAAQRYWQSQIASGMSPSDLGTNLQNTAVSDAYRSILGRAPDEAGQQYWQQQMAGGMTQAQMNEALRGSSEGQYQQGVRDMNAASYRNPELARQYPQLNAWYQQYLGRDLDANGIVNQGHEDAIRNSAEAQAYAKRLQDLSTPTNYSQQMRNGGIAALRRV